MIPHFRSESPRIMMHLRLFPHLRAPNRLRTFAIRLISLLAHVLALRYSTKKSAQLPTRGNCALFSYSANLVHHKKRVPTLFRESVLLRCTKCPVSAFRLFYLFYVECVHLRIACCIAEFFLNSKQLVILRHTL